VFALVTTSGTLIVYNRYVSAHAIVKMTAHSGDATTLDWHPLRPNVIATGGANDRSVKVWDLEDALSLNLRDDGYVAINSNSLTSRGESIGTNDSSGNDSYK
jgi:WD40 repeat protein